MAVGLHAARRAGVQSGDRVVLIGAGAIGSFVLGGLRSLADADITVIDFPGSRLERAARLGATRTIEAGPDAAARVRDSLGEAGAHGVEVVIEASGAPGQLNNAIEMVRTGGTILQVGLPGKQQEVDVHTLVMREISVVTTLAHVCGDDLGAALAILASSDLADEVLESVSSARGSARTTRTAGDRQAGGQGALRPGADPGMTDQATTATRTPERKGASSDESSSLLRIPRHSRRGRRRTRQSGAGGGVAASQLVRHLRHRPARVRDGPHRHPGRPRTG